MKVGERSVLEASHSSSSRSALLSCWPGTYETTVIAVNSPLRLDIKSQLFTTGVRMGRTLFLCQEGNESIIKLLASIVVWIWSVRRLICWTLGSKLQLLSWEVLEARSRSLRSMALKVMPGPDSPPHRLLTWAKEPPLPHVPTAMVFCPSAWDWATMNWTLWNKVSRTKSSLGIGCFILVTVMQK